jgi:hypothetical protein
MRLSFENSWELRPEFPRVDNEQQKLQTKNQTKPRTRLYALMVMRVINAIANRRQQIHDDLRKQHPEWILPNGESPICDVYEARLMNLLALVPGFYLWRPTERQHIGD